MFSLSLSLSLVRARFRSSLRVMLTVAYAGRLHINYDFSFTTIIFATTPERLLIYSRNRNTREIIQRCLLYIYKCITIVNIEIMKIDVLVWELFIKAKRKVFISNEDYSVLLNRIINLSLSLSVFPSLCYRFN